MTGTFVKVLMAASALVPVAASAQRIGADVGVSPEGRLDRGDRWVGGDRRDDRQRQDASRAQADVTTTARIRTDMRPDRDDDRRAYRGDGQRRPDFQRDRRDDRPAFDQSRRDDRPGFRQDRRDDRQVWRTDRRNEDYGVGGGRPYSGYGSAQGYDRRYDDRGQWNRTWRNDGRYAWSDYRAANRNAYRLPRYYAPNGWGSGYRRFGVGVSLNSVLFDPTYWIQDPYSYRLPDAYGPYRWVRYYNDALLVDLDSGRVVDTVYGIFW